MTDWFQQLGVARRNVERADPDSLEKLSSSAVHLRHLFMRAMRERTAKSGLRYPD